MAQMVRCPLTGESCMKTIEVEEKTFFLAEPKEPEEDRKRRCEAITLSLETLKAGWKIRSALTERQPYAFTCKICEMIQGCAYGIADISTANLNVILELGMMISLGKPAVILCRKGKGKEIELPSDLKAIEVIPFSEYIDIVTPLREITVKLPPPSTTLSPIEMTEQTLKEARPELAEEIRKTLDIHKKELINEFKGLMKKIKVGAINHKPEEKVRIDPKLKKKLEKIEKSLADIERVGVITDPETALLRARLTLDDDDYQAAISAIDKYIDFEVNSKEAWFIKGLALHKLGRVKDAIPAYTEVLRIEPNDINTQLNLAEAYVITGSYADGISLAKDSEKRAKTARDKSNAIFLIVVALLLQDELDEADIVVNRLVQRLRKLKKWPRSGWDYADIDPTMKKLKGPKKELAFSIKALLSKEIDLDEFVKERPKFRPRK